jgi:hypothetical protein
MAQMKTLLIQVAIATNRDPSNPDVARDAQQLIDNPTSRAMFRRWWNSRKLCFPPDGRRPDSTD